MPITLPNLDDRRYQDLVEDARRLIPAYAPEWTNHNPSDPGVTIVEMFAYLAEMLIYRLNRVTDANLAAFLKLIDGVDRQGMGREQLVTATRGVVLELRRPQRAVTAADFEQLVVEGFRNQVARARCVPERSLESDDPQTRSKARPGHVSVIIVPKTAPTGAQPVPGSGLLKSVRDYLEPRRLLTTRLHVVGPRYVKVGVRFTLTLKPDWLEKDVRPEAGRALRTFLSPLTGGADGNGWPFGRNVYVSELYELLDGVDGVDFVTQSKNTAALEPELIVTDPHRLITRRSGELIAVEIHPDELVDPFIKDDDIKIQSPSGTA